MERRQPEMAPGATPGQSNGFDAKKPLGDSGSQLQPGMARAAPEALSRLDQTEPDVLAGVPVAGTASPGTL